MSNRKYSTRPLLTYDALRAARKAGTLVAWLEEMTSAERVDAAHICAGADLKGRSVSEWLRTFGELVDAARDAEQAARAEAEGLEVPAGAYRVPAADGELVDVGDGRWAFVREGRALAVAADAQTALEVGRRSLTGRAA